MIADIPAIDLTKYIERRHFGDRPHIRGRRIPVWVIASAARDNDIRQLMYDFNLSEAEVLATLLYYIEHNEEGDSQEAAIREQYKHYYEQDQSKS